MITVPSLIIWGFLLGHTLPRGHENMNIIVTIDRPSWLAEACKILPLLLGAGQPSSSLCAQEEAGEGTRPRGHGWPEPGHMHPPGHLCHCKSTRYLSMQVLKYLAQPCILSYPA